MTFKKVMATLFATAEGTFYKWKKQQRPIVLLIEKYFTKEDIEEFLETGKITKLENIAPYDYLSEKHLIDLSFYILKPKLKDLFAGSIFDKVYNKGSKDILIDVLKKISVKDKSFTVDNAKDRLLDRISQEELKWLSLKNPAKRDLLSHYIKEDFSNAEILAMVQRNSEVIEFLKKT